MKILFPIILALLLILNSCGGEKNNRTKTHDMEDNGLVVKTSNNDFETTYTKLRTMIDGNPNLKILLELDHSKNAASVDLQLPPTRIIMFGNPNLGTPLMQSASSIAIDLPQKIVVSEGEDGTVSITYNNPEYLRMRHNLESLDVVLTKITGALDKITTAATIN